MKSAKTLTLDLSPRRHTSHSVLARSGPTTSVEVPLSPPYTLASASAVSDSCPDQNAADLRNGTFRTVLIMMMVVVVVVVVVVRGRVNDVTFHFQRGCWESESRCMLAGRALFHTHAFSKYLPRCPIWTVAFEPPFYQPLAGPR